MKYTQKIEREVEVTHLVADMGVRYWEDGCVNDEPDDDDNPQMPLATKDGWKLVIALDTGAIVGWPQGVTAETHYKVCDAGVYALMNGSEVVTRKDGYVPSMLAPMGEGYGDYVILSIGADGVIAGWKPNLHYFGDDE